MHARDGHWVGFDPELDGHCIYCANCGTVGVEQSIVFERQTDVTISTSVSAQPEGEKRNSHTDMDGTSQEHRHAISGYTYILDGGAVSWM